MPKRVLVGVFALGIAVLGASVQAIAAPILIVRDFGGGPPPPNDCTGVFGGGNSPCDVGFALGEEVSPWIAKYEFDDGTPGAKEKNAAFASIDFSEFTVNNAGGTSGTWSYAPGVDDPAVRYWVAKGGRQGFRLHWMVESTTVGNTCDGDAYNLACLNLALAVQGGDWSTLSGSLSHITFYDSGNRDVPEPVTLGLFGAGALAAGFARRRRNR